MLLTISPVWTAVLVVLAAAVIGTLVGLLVASLLGPTTFGAFKRTLGIIAGIAVALILGLIVWSLIISTVTFSPVRIAPPVVNSNPDSGVPYVDPIAPTLTPPMIISPTVNAAPQTNQPQTCGLIFPAYSGGTLNTNYDVRVDCWFENGAWHLRGWQFRLPPNREAHTVAIQIPKGNYVFNGVVCRLFLDEERNGQGSSNPMVAGNGNNLAFTVNVDIAYALIECDGGTPSGFDYWSQ